MAKTLTILTEWLSELGHNQMRAAFDHPAPGVAYTDVTGQPDAIIPTDPNIAVVLEEEIVEHAF